MSEYCEYMWDSTRGHTSSALARSIYEEEHRFDKRDKKLAIKTVRAILREMPDVDLKHCTDEYITRFLLARKYRTEQAAALIGAYQAQITHRQDIFGNLTARDPALQRALRAGIPGVLPARDRKGRCVLVILASQWDPIAVPALSVQRAIFLVLEILIQDPRNQQSGFVAVVDWSGFSLRQGGALGAAALRNLITALRGRFPARFKAIHFLSAPLYVQATLALVKPFLDEKTRNKIYLHGNNLSTLHEYLPTDILPAELGGTGPAFNPGLWAEPVIHAAMKEAEIAAATAAAKKGKEQQQNVDANARVQEPANLQDQSKTNDGSNVLTDLDKTSLNNAGSNPAKCHSGKTIRADVELNVISKRSNNREKTTEVANDNERFVHIERDNNENVDATHRSDDRTDHQLKRSSDDLTFLDVEANSSEFEIIPSRSGSESSKDNSLDNRLEGNALIAGINGEAPSEETNLIT
ncbi:clavesin-2 [Ooceraea biroi]|nr:clavesin-2 [Ooceraea biroi]XP_019887583.1 clavesin-2 [Ooceraea biroi]XP_019887585.1 clavesin-2 [Ooceraea biroi]XP_026826497.1 clavesin-2 [Ooceraea biroi]XP_026826499.1 clavesin-2 [Ooceraea biroi]XP_026826502.1 clavesin-2 [Ooceraea biroi]XP_026826509.1 clavesin-2 [Ooceraea biroi]EZA54189.1 Clavesin-2 [Ooceraea biroi]